MVVFLEKLAFVIIEPDRTTSSDERAVFLRFVIAFTVDNEQPLRLEQSLRLLWAQHRLVIVPGNLQRGITARTEEQEWGYDKHRPYGLSSAKHYLPPLWRDIRYR
jgi:hypothetical protein